MPSEMVSTIQSGERMQASTMPAGAPAVDSPEWWRRVERTDVSADPDKATAQVIRRMCELAASSASDPVLRGYARQAVRQFRGGPLWAAAGVDPFTAGAGDGRRAAAIAESVWLWAKFYLRFVHHSRMIWDRLRERDQWQLLISPDALVQMRPMKGDCAVYSSLIAAMLQALGVPWEFETLAVDPEQPEVYSHVFVLAVMPDGSRVPLDASHGDYPGWQVPAHDVYRSQVWDSAGRPVKASRKFRGLHSYAWRRGRRGLGDTNLWDVWGLDPAVDAGYAPPTAPAAPVYSTGGAGSGSGGTDWGGVFSNMLNRWTTIGGQVLAPQVSYQRGPGGQLSYSAPAGAASNSLLPGSLGGAAVPWGLVAGGVGILALVLMVGSKGGK